MLGVCLLSSAEQFPHGQDGSEPLNLPKAPALDDVLCSTLAAEYSATLGGGGSDAVFGRRRVEGGDRGQRELPVADEAGIGQRGPWPCRPSPHLWAPWPGGDWSAPLRSSPRRDRCVERPAGAAVRGRGVPPDRGPRRRPRRPRREGVTRRTEGRRRRRWTPSPRGRRDRTSDFLIRHREAARRG